MSHRSVRRAVFEALAEFDGGCIEVSRGMYCIDGHLGDLVLDGIIQDLGSPRPARRASQRLSATLGDEGLADAARMRGSCSASYPGSPVHRARLATLSSAERALTPGWCVADSIKPKISTKAVAMVEAGAAIGSIDFLVVGGEFQLLMRGPHRRHPGPRGLRARAIPRPDSSKCRRRALRAADESASKSSAISVLEGIQ